MKSIALPYVISCMTIFSAQEIQPSSYPPPLTENTTISMEPHLLYPPQKSNNDKTLNSKENNFKKMNLILYKNFKKNEMRQISVSHLKERYPLDPEDHTSKEKEMNTRLINDIMNALRKLNKQYRFSIPTIQSLIIDKQIKNGLIPHNINFLASQIMDELEKETERKEINNNSQSNILQHKSIIGNDADSSDFTWQCQAQSSMSSWASIIGDNQEYVT